MNGELYLISRTEYNTQASMQHGDSFVSLLKDSKTIPAYPDSYWEDVQNMRAMRSELGIGSNGACLVTYSVANHPYGSAEGIRKAMTEAGFPNVYMVADTDAVLAHYDETCGVLSRTDGEEGCIILSIRTTVSGGALSAVLCRNHFQEVITTDLYGLDDGSFFDIPWNFFRNLRSKWGKVSCVLYHGYYGACNEMIGYISACFPEAEILADWAEILPGHRMKLHSGLEKLAPKLMLCSSISAAWNIAMESNSLAHSLDENFMRNIPQVVKSVSDTGSFMFEALGEWVRKENVRAKNGRFRPMEASMLVDHANELLEDHLRHPIYFRDYQLPAMARCILSCALEAGGIPGDASDEPDFANRLMRRFRKIHASGTEYILREETARHWLKIQDRLKDSMRLSARANQIESMQNELNELRRNCRSSALEKLLEAIDLPALRLDFLEDMIGFSRHFLQNKLDGLFHPLMLECKSTRTLCCPPSREELEELLGCYEPNLQWSEGEHFSDVDTRTYIPNDTIPADDATPWWEYID